MDPMILSVLYVWCQLNKDMVVQFWFGTRFKVRYNQYFDCSYIFEALQGENELNQENLHLKMLSV